MSKTINSMDEMVAALSTGKVVHNVNGPKLKNLDELNALTEYIDFNFKLEE